MMVERKGAQGGAQRRPGWETGCRMTRKAASCRGELDV
jgi:hypothetical protein